MNAALLAAGLARELRLHGVRSGRSRELAFAHALYAAPPQTAGDLYWSARIAMLPGIEALEKFESAFARFFGLNAPPAQSLSARAERAPSPSAQRAREGDRTHHSLLALAASEERLAQRDFALMTERERAAARLLMRRLAGAGERRRTRRKIAGRGRRYDLAATLRASLRTGGEIIRLRRHARRERLRPLFFVLDLSGSMEPYGQALLTYSALALRARRDVRVLCFATRLWEVGPMLAAGEIDAALARIAALVHDRGGGTRIGASLYAFNRRYARRGAARGATIVIVSDGWEREDPRLVESEMRELRRLCRRIVWVNPQKRHPAYEPLVKGMAAAMPYIDAFLCGHNLRALEEIAAAIEGASHA